MKPCAFYLTPLETPFFEAVIRNFPPEILDVHVNSIYSTKNGAACPPVAIPYINRLKDCGYNVRHLDKDLEAVFTIV